MLNALIVMLVVCLRSSGLGSSGGCPCDLNGDGVADASDLAIFDVAYDAGDPEADFNADGGIDESDRVEFLACVNDPTGYGCTPPMPPANDSCATPTSMSGFGVFPFDLQGALTGAQGQGSAACNLAPGNSPAIRNDVWFCWTAPTSGEVRLDTLGLTDVDTKIAVYAGCVCPASGASPLACNDDVDVNVSQSSLTFNATLGGSYLIQLGKSPVLFGGDPGATSGQLRLQSLAPPLTVLTTNTTIGVGNTSYEFSNLVVRGCTVTIDGAHVFASLTIEPNGLNQPGVVTHTSGQAGMAVLVVGEMSIGSLCRVDLNGRGAGPGGGARPGANGPDYGGGGGHGGAGGTGATFGGVGGGTTGSMSQPVALGSGGGSTGRNGQTFSVGGRGGGAIQLVVGGTLTLLGSITADGTAGDGNGSGGGGSGGSIWITAAELAGNGTISARGGTSSNPGAGGGGGGRIAVYAETSSLPLSGIRALAGSGNGRGGAGTVYVQLADDPRPTLIVDAGQSGRGAETPISGPQDLRALTGR